MLRVEDIFQNAKNDTSLNGCPTEVHHVSKDVQLFREHSLYASLDYDKAEKIIFGISQET